jgi:hypothetical protein
MDLTVRSCKRSTNWPPDTYLPSGANEYIHLCGRVGGGAIQVYSRRQVLQPDYLRGQLKLWLLVWHKLQVRWRLLWVLVTVVSSQLMHLHIAQEFNDGC